MSFSAASTSTFVATQTAQRVVSQSSQLANTSSQANTVATVSSETTPKARPLDPDVLGLGILIVVLMGTFIAASFVSRSIAKPRN